MKKLLLLLLCVPLLFSCVENDKDKKENNWKKEHKDNFMDAYIRGIPGYEFTYSQKEQYCSCSLGRMMEQYNTAEEMDEAALKWTLEDIMKQAEPCVDFLK